MRSGAATSALSHVTCCALKVTTGRSSERRAEDIAIDQPLHESTSSWGEEEEEERTEGRKRRERKRRRRRRSRGRPG